MAELSEESVPIQASLFFTRKELQALRELGQRLALEGEPIATHISDHTAIDLAIMFIVGANLWEARQALGLPGDH